MILLTLAEHSAISIENTRFQERLKHYSEKLEDLVEERTENLRQSEQRQRALLEIGNAIIAHLDKQSLFNAIAHALEKVVDFDVAALALLDPVRDVVKVHALAVTSPRKPFAPGGNGVPSPGKSSPKRARPEATVHTPGPEDRTSRRLRGTYAEGWDPVIHRRPPNR